MKTPIIIGTVCQDGWEYTKKFFEDISSIGNNCVSVLIDNASTDQTIEEGPKIANVYKRNETSLYCARAWNQIIDIANGFSLDKEPFIVIVNNDIRIRNSLDWILDLIKCADKFSPAVVTNSIVGAGQKILREPRQHPEIISPYFYKLGGIVFSGYLSTFVLIGGFDSAYETPFSEDCDFWMECFSKKVNVIISDYKILHSGSGTVGKIHGGQRREWLKKNREYFHEKWKDILGKKANEEL